MGRILYIVGRSSNPTIQRRYSVLVKIIVGWSEKHRSLLKLLQLEVTLFWLSAEILLVAVETLRFKRSNWDIFLAKVV